MLGVEIWIDVVLREADKYETMFPLFAIHQLQTLRAPGCFAARRIEPLTHTAISKRYAVESR